MDSGYSSSAGISGATRSELAAVTGRGHRLIGVADAVNALGIDAQAAAMKLARWADQGWLRRVRRGMYIPVPVDAENPKAWTEDALIIATAIWSPCYFTGWTAANHWGLSEQVFRTVVLKTTARVRASRAEMLDHEYLVAHTDKRHLSWGMESAWQDGVRLNYADPTRTVVEILDAPRLAGGIRHAAEILGAYLGDHDPDRLIDYGDRLGNRTVFKRLGYLTEAIGAEQPSLIEACRHRLSAGVSLLDPDGPRGGLRVPEWNLRANVHVSETNPS
ncbi:MAG: type IV toxin-antitoxin system AbiEi family antitoxin domain-containing protein [Dehalococcoidia bacterium]